MNKHLFLGTTNVFKISVVKAAIQGLSIELLTPTALNLALQVAENGQTTLQNAELKAKAYFEQVKLPTLAIDGGLWVEKFSAEQQPGAWVKRPRGGVENASDEEVLELYLRELQKVGGESLCTWEGSLALAVPGGRLFSSTFSFQTLLTTKVRGKALSGVALAPITLDPATGRYHSELDWDERPDVFWIRRFLRSHLEQL